MRNPCLRMSRPMSTSYFMCPRSARVNSPSHSLPARLTLTVSAGRTRLPLALLIVFTSSIGPMRSSAARCVSMLLTPAPVSMRASTFLFSPLPCTVTCSASPMMMSWVMLLLVRAPF